MDFGAFVELAPGVDALLHVSQISRAHVEKPSDVLAVGQEITAKVVELNEKQLESFNKMLDKLNDNDDVIDVIHNLEEEDE